MDGFGIVLIHAIGGAIGILIVGPFFNCKVPPVKAVAAASISGLFYMVPTAGAVLSLMVLILLVGIWGTGDWDDALYTSFIARLVMVPVGLMFGFPPY